MANLISSFLARWRAKKAWEQEWKLWVAELKGRTAANYAEAWSGIDTQLPLNNIFAYIAEMMQLPCPYFYPTDNLFMVLHDRWGELRDVSVIMYLEEILHVDMGEFYEKHLDGEVTLAELFEVAKTQGFQG